MQANLRQITLYWRKYDIYLIMVLAAILRLAKLRYAFYGTTGELYRDLDVVYDFLIRHQWPLLGPNSALGNFHFGAVYYYLMAPFVYLFNFTPMGAVFVSAFFSILSVLVFYKLLEKWFSDKGIARLGGLLLALSLYDIQNAYYVSNPTILPFFVLLFLYYLTRILEGESNWKNFVFLGLSFGVAIQLHATALLLLPVLLIICLLNSRTNFTIGKLSLFLLTALVPSLPNIYYELTHHFSNVKALLGISESHFGWLVSLGSLGNIVSFWDRLFFFKNTFFNLVLLHPAAYFFLLPFYFAMPFVVYFYLRKSRGQSRIKLQASRPAKLILVTWLAPGMVLYLFFHGDLQHFYFLVFWPAPVVLLTWFLYWLKLNSKLLYRYVLTVYLGLQILQLPFFYQAVVKHEFDYKKMRTLLYQVSDDADGETFNVINSTFDVNLFLYYLKIYHLSDRITRSQASYVYLIKDLSSEEQTMANLPDYRESASFVQGKVMATKYVKIK